MLPQDKVPRGLEVQPEGEPGAVAWMANEELGCVGGVGTHSGDASFLVVAHAPIHCSYDEDVFRLDLTVQQGGGGDFTCRREGCGREGLGGPGRDWGGREEQGEEEGERGKQREGEYERGAGMIK